MFKSICKRGLLVGALLLAVPAASYGQVFHTVRDLLSAQFSKSDRVSFVKVAADSKARARIEKRLGRKLAAADYTFYVAKTGERVDGYALFDQEKGQHEPISFATFFDAAGSITRVEVVAYREPYGDGIRAERFRKQFIGRKASSGFRADADIDVISGATISSRSLCKGVKRASVLLDEAVLRANDKSVLAAR